MRGRCRRVGWRTDGVEARARRCASLQHESAWRERAGALVQIAVATVRAARTPLEAEELQLHHQGLFGPGTSDSTMRRLLLAGLGDKTLAKIAKVRQRVRRHVDAAPPAARRLHVAHGRRTEADGLGSLSTWMPRSSRVRPGNNTGPHHLRGHVRLPPAGRPAGEHRREPRDGTEGGQRGGERRGRPRLRPLRRTGSDSALLEVEDPRTRCSASATHGLLSDAWRR